MKIKQLVSVVLISCISTICNAQFATLSLIKQNIAYLGIDNPFEVAVSNYPVSAIRVKTNNGTIEGADGIYTLRPKTEGICYITVEVIKNGKKKLVEEFPIRIKAINECFAHIGNYYKSNLYPLYEFKVQMGLVIELSYEYGFDAKVMVVSYKSIIVKDSTRQSKYFENIGPYFSNEFKEEILKLEPNDKVIIYEIKGMFPNGNEYSAESLIYTMI